MTRASRSPLRAVAALVVPLAIACREPATPPMPVETRDLVSLFEEAEVRSDSQDLPFLVERRGPGWAAVAGTPAAPLLWSRREAALLRLPFFSTSDKELRLALRCHTSMGPRLEVAIALNAHPLGSLVLTQQEQEFRLVMPSAFQVTGENALSLTLVGWREPAKEERQRGKGTRGLGLSGVRIRRLATTDTVTTPEVREGAIRLPAASSIAYVLRHKSGSALDVEAVAGPAVGARFSVGLETEQSRSPVAEATLAAGGRHHTHARFEAPAGAFVRLEMANSGDGSLTLEAPRLTSAASSGRARPAGRALPERPNIVVFLTDTLRADYLGAYGHKAPTSPRFDAFARESILFDDAVAQAPWTRSAVASIFTGLHVGSHGVDRIDVRLAAQHQTLAETLKASGYRTGGYFSSYVVRAAFGFGQGFDSWDDGKEDEFYWAPAPRIVERALQWVDEGSGPFFLYIHTLEPHSPYKSEDRSWAPFRFPYEGETDTIKLLEQARFHVIKPEGLRYLEARYEGEILQNDEAFGALVDGLSKRGLLDTSTVVFLSDHGEEFLDHGQVEHGKTLYREVLRIPLAVRLPRGLRGGVRETYPVQQIDLMPTLLALAGVPAPPVVEGRDVSAQWLGTPWTDEVPPSFFSEVRFEICDKYAVRVGGLKLVRNYDNPAVWPAGEEIELYDMERDPMEKTNLVGSRPLAARYLANSIAALRRLHEKLRLSKPEDRVSLSPRDKEQLRALGYIQ